MLNESESMILRRGDIFFEFMFKICDHFVALIGLLASLFSNMFASNWIPLKSVKIDHIGTRVTMGRVYKGEKTDEES